jgi:hypothetical protein
MKYKFISLIVIAIMSLLLWNTNKLQSSNKELANQLSKSSDNLRLEADKLAFQRIELEKQIRNKDITIKKIRGLISPIASPNSGGVLPAGTELGYGDTLSGIIKRTLPKETKYEGQLVDALQLADEIESQSLLMSKEIIILTDENNRLREALVYKDKAYAVQLEVNKAYSEAMLKAKLKYSFMGIGIGFIAGALASN